MKEELLKCIQLAHFRNDSETIVSVDASHEGLGACLQQKQDWKLVTIEFASRSIPNSYKTAHLNELECLAVHWAVTERFRFYLAAQKHFTVITDNWAVAHLQAKNNINRKYTRWILDLQEFSFTVKHHKGEKC
uniref:Reverse transcriptase RNase H-like domain-containing protein n=1 Tax=Strigamia maritima TaxID=126957 RepID=T1IM39_STRMM